MKYTRSSTLYLLFALAVLFWLSPPAAAQVGVTSLYPAVGSENISVTSFMYLKTSHTIEPGTVGITSPYIWGGDSLNPQVTEAPVMLIRKDDYDNLPDSLWRTVAVQAMCIVYGDDTVGLYPIQPLDYETDYTLVVENLKVLVPDIVNPSIVDTVIIDTVFTTAFTTADLPPVITSTSLDDMAPVLCNAEISVAFSEKLTSATTGAGPLLSLQRIDSVYYPVDTLHPVILPGSVSATSTLAPDSMGVVIEPTGGFLPGSNYMLTVHMSRITGEAGDDRTIPFNVKDAARITIGGVPVDSGDILPIGCMATTGDGPFLMRAGDTIELEAPLVVGDFQFARWVCDNDPTINDVTTNTVSLATSGCSDLYDRNISIEYERVIIDTIFIKPTIMMAHCDIVVYGARDSLGSGLYTLPRLEGWEVKVVITPDSGYKFTHWISDEDDDLDGEPSPMISINAYLEKARANGGRIDLSPWLEPVVLVNCNQVSFCVQVHYQGAQDPGVDIRNFFSTNVQVSGDAYFLSGCTTFNIPPTPRPFTVNYMVNASISDPCYEIAYYWSGYDIRAGRPYTMSTLNPDGIPVGSSMSQLLSITVPAEACSKTLNIYIRKKKFKLTVELEMKDGKQIPWSVITNAKIQPKKEPKIEKTYMTSAVGTLVLQKVKLIYTYDCGTQVTATPWTRDNSGYTIGEWYCGTGYTCTTILNPYTSGPPGHPVNGQEILQFTMDEDKKIKLLFGSGFELQYVRLMEPTGSGSFRPFKLINDGNDKTPYLDDDYNFDEGVGLGFDMEGLPQATGHSPHHKYSTMIEFYFSDRVDESTLPGRLYVQDIEAGESAQRKDQKDNTIYDYRSAGSSGILGMNDKNGKLTGNGSRVQLLLTDENRQWMAHMTRFRIVVEEGIMSDPLDPNASPAELDNPQPNGIDRVSALPGIYVENVNFWTSMNDSYGGNPEVFIHCVAAIDDENVHINTSDGYKLDDKGRFIYTTKSKRFPEGTDAPDRNTPVEWTDRAWLLEVNNLRANHRIDIGFHAIDDNSGSAFEKFADIIGDATTALIDKFNTQGQDKLPVSKGWQVGSALVSAAGRFMESNWENDQTMYVDDFILSRDENTAAINNVVTDRLWGAKYLYQTKQLIREKKAIDALKLLFERKIEYVPVFRYRIEVTLGDLGR